MDLKQAEERVTETGCDGVMLGRAIFGNPWCFNREISRDDISIPERLKVMVEHTKLFEELLPHKSFAIMKKHYKAYVNGFDGAKDLRHKLIESKDFEEFKKNLREANVSVDEIKIIRVSEVIKEIQQFIVDLVKKGYGYVTEDGIYFSIEKYEADFGDYGALVGEKFIEGKKVGARGQNN